MCVVILISLCGVYYYWNRQSAQENQERKSQVEADLESHNQRQKERMDYVDRASGIADSAVSGKPKNDEDKAKYMKVKKAIVSAGETTPMISDYDKKSEESSSSGGKGKSGVEIVRNVASVIKFGKFTHTIIVYTLYIAHNNLMMILLF